MIYLKKISKAFNGKIVLNEFSYEFISKNKYLVSGLNGSGKTTLFRIMSNLLEADSGFIECPSNITVSYTDSSERSFFLMLSAYENLKYFLSLEGMEIKEFNEKFNELTSIFKISKLRNVPMQQLSSGQTQIFNIIRSFLKDSEVTIFDESLNYLDIERKKLVKKYIDHQLIGNEKIYIFSSHRDEDANDFELNLIRLADV